MPSAKHLSFATIAIVYVLAIYSVVCQDVTEGAAALKSRPPPSRVSEMKCHEYATASLRKPRVAGGVNAELMEFPHVVRIGIQSQKGKILFTCSAALISDEWLLTTARCTFGASRGSRYARVGEYEYRGANRFNEFDVQANDYAVAEQIKHPNSTISSFENDIALLRLDRKVKFIRPACLAEQFQPSTDAVATGWAQSNHQFARTLLKVELEVFTQEECNDVYDIDQNDGEDKITSTQICAGSRSQNGKGSCQGDGGSPIQMRHPYYSNMYEIIGVFLANYAPGVFSRGCGHQNHPGIYTRVFSHLDWIEQHVWPVEYSNFTITPGSAAIATTPMSTIISTTIDTETTDGSA